MDDDIIYEIQADLRSIRSQNEAGIQEILEALFELEFKEAA